MAGRVYALTSFTSIVQSAVLEVRAPGCAAAVLEPDTSGWTFVVPVDGQYSVAVRFRERSSADIGAYALTVEDLGPGEDDHPDAPTGSLLLRTDGTALSGTVDRAYDTD